MYCGYQLSHAHLYINDYTHSLTASANHVTLSRSTARPPPQVNVSSTAAINEIISGQGNVTQSTGEPPKSFAWISRRLLMVSDVSAAVNKKSEKNFNVFQNSGQFIHTLFLLRLSLIFVVGLRPQNRVQVAVPSSSSSSQWFAKWPIITNVARTI